MKLYRSFDYNDVFGMSNLNPQRAGLSVEIWSDHGGIKREKRDKDRRVKITYNNACIGVSISSRPEVLAESGVKKSDWKHLKRGIDYVARNYDIFLKHYMDTTFEFDDEDFYQALRDRGEYR